MRRRAVLSSVGAGALGLLGFRAGGRDALSIRVWFTEAAAEHDPPLGDRVRAHLRESFGHVAGVDVSLGGTVAVPTEDGYDVFVADGGWQDAVTGGPLDAPSVDAVDGVNLLVTDGPMDAPPTGAGGSGVASVGGASLVAAAAPPDGETVVPYRRPEWATQVLLHECGHALGLDHADGAILRLSGRYVVTPMVSSYAWASAATRAARFDHDGNACGAPFPERSGGVRALSLRFSRCAEAKLTGRRGLVSRVGGW